MPLANTGAVLSRSDGPKGCDPAVQVIWVRFRRIRRYLAYGPDEIRRIHNMLDHDNDNMLDHENDNDNDNDNDTLKEVQHLSMKAWPYRQECRGHDPAKKESVALMKLALLAKWCTNPLLRTVGSASKLEMNSKYRNRHVTTHRLLLV